MNLTIEEKLKLNQTPICFFKEGMFLRVLNESFYILEQHFKLNLKPKIKLIKKINQTVIIGGFPVDSMMAKFPDAKPTLFGYQLLGHYDLSGYDEWFANYIIADKLSTASTTNPHQQSPKTLTEQQLAFLELWQPNLYPHIVDTAFIKELKEYFLS